MALHFCVKGVLVAAPQSAKSFGPQRPSALKHGQKINGAPPLNVAAFFAAAQQGDYFLCIMKNLR